jgi:hypothetical protein
MHQNGWRARLPPPRRRRQPPSCRRGQNPMHQFPRPPSGLLRNRRRQALVRQRRQNPMHQNAPHTEQATPRPRPDWRRSQEPMHQHGRPTRLSPSRRRHPPARRQPGQNPLQQFRRIPPRLCRAKRRRAPVPNPRQNPMHQNGPHTEQATPRPRPSWRCRQEPMHQNAPQRRTAAAGPYRSALQHAAGCVSRSSCTGTGPQVISHDAGRHVSPGGLGCRCFRSAVDAQTGPPAVRVDAWLSALPVLIACPLSGLIIGQPGPASRTKRYHPNGHGA